MPVPTNRLSSSSSSSSSSLCSSPMPKSSPISWLPVEVFSRALGYLDDPLDLYNASRVDHSWRAAATDPRLWQPHYWAFYRVPLIVQSDEDQLLLDRRTTNRRNAMRTFINRCTSAAPPSPLGPLASCSPSGEILLYEPLEKGLLMLYSMLGFGDAIVRTAVRLNDLVVELYGDKGPDDKDEAAERIIEQLVKESGKTPTAEDIEYARRAYEEKSEPPSIINFAERAPSYPPFLVSNQNDGRDSKPLPMFYTLFAKRLNADERLLLDLRTHINLEAGILDDVFSLLDRYGDGARDLLIALSASQRLTTQSISVFAEKPGSPDSGSKWPRALDVHACAATGRPQMRVEDCMALQYTAQKLLGHLQRCEAVRSLRQLRTRVSSPLPKKQTFRERVSQCCLGVEEGMEDVSLFRFGERAEIREYLALLAIHVWKDLEARARILKEGPIDEETVNQLEGPPDPHLPSGSTRLFLAKMETSLRRLGFATPTDPDVAHEVDNCYLNTSLLCPAQRVTSPLALCVILCAIARRLGVAAAPVNSSGGAMIVVVEEGEQPKNWRYDLNDWARFYWMPVGGDRSHLLRASQVREQRANLGLTPRRTSPSEAAKDLKRLLEPASPLDILLRLSNQMVRAVVLTAGSARRRQTLDGIDERVEHHAPFAGSSSTSPTEQVTSLRDYLWGRSGEIPWPLPAPILLSSLALLPPTKAGFPRVNPYDLRKETLYCSRWINRIADSSKTFKDADNDLSKAVASRGDFYCDATLMMENHGLNVKKELDMARRAVKEGRADDHGRDCASEILRAARQYIAGVLESDPRKGVAGHGGSPGKERVRELLDPAHARNAAVAHRIGTVFTHREHGARAVIYGWDRVYREPSVSIWDDKVIVEPTPASARKQPHYYAYCENGARRYVAQSNIEVARVPAGATTQQATNLLRQFLPLFNMRSVAEKFKTICVEPWEAKAASSSGGKKKAGGGGQIKMVMTPWMRSIWPFD